MTRGNQRETDRQRAQKKQEEKLKAAGRVSVFAIICSNISIQSHIILASDCGTQRNRVGIH